MKGKYLLPQEAAEYLGISLSTLYRVENRGGIKPIRTPGGHRRYAVELLDSYLVAAASFKPIRKPIKPQVAEVIAENQTVAKQLVNEEVYETQPTETLSTPLSTDAIDLSATADAPLFKPSAHIIDLRGGQA